MEFEGTVVKVLPAMKGTSARGEWTKQDVVFEQPGEFGRKICVGFWGDKAMDAAALKEGEVVSISANVESREYNGRWYTEVRAWKMVRGGGQQPAQTPARDFAPMPPISTETYSDSAADNGAKEDYDDLPF
jgi:hypothetical protein